MADLYYIESGYLIPDAGYFTYTANADAALTCQATVTISAGVIKQGSLTMSAAFTQTAIGTRGKDIDLFAFNEASIAVQISVIRSNNIAATSIFNIATDGRRYRDIITTEEFSVFDFIVTYGRSRATSMETQAAFSLAADVQRIPPATTAAADLTSEFSTTTVVEKITNTTISLSSTTAVSTIFDRLRDTNAAIISQSMLFATAEKIAVIDSQLSSQATLSATISHIHGADILVNGFASLDVLANKIASVDIGLSSSTDLNAASTRIQETSSNHYSEFAVTSSVEAILSVSSNQIAEVDLSASVIRIQELNSNFVAAFSQASIEQRLRGFNSQLSAQSQLTATISHIEGADILVNGFASLTATADNLPRQFSANLVTTSNVQAAGGFTFQYAAALKAYSSILVSRNAYSSRPIQINGSPTISSTQKKYGAYSARVTAGLSTFSYPADIKIKLSDTFVTEGWYYQTIGLQSTPIIYLGAGSLTDTSVGQNQWAVYFRVYTINTATRYGFRLLTRNSSGQTVYFDSAEYTVDTLPFTRNPINNSINAQWNHFAVTKDSSNVMRFYINGSEIVSGTISSIGSATQYRIGYGKISTDQYAYWDEISYRKGTTSIAGLNSGITDSGTGQVFLFHFEEFATQIPTDDISNTKNITQQVAASLPVIASVTAKLSGPVHLSGSLTSTSSLTATISHIEGADMFAFANAAMAIDATRVRFADSSSSAEFSETASGQLIRDIVSPIVANSDLSATALRIQEGNIATESIATQLTAVVRIAGLLVDDLVESFLTANVNVIRSANSDQASNATVDIFGTRVRYFDSANSSEFALTADGDVRIQGFSSISSEFTQVSNAERYRGIDVALQEFTYLSATANNLGKIEASLFNAASLIANVTKTVDVAKSLESTSTLYVDTSKAVIREFLSTQNSQADLAANPVKTARISADLTAFSSELVIGVKTGSAKVVCDNFASMNITAVKTVAAETSMDNVVVQTAFAVKTVSVASNNNIDSQLSAQGIFVTSARADLTAFAFELAAVAKIGDFLVSMDVAANLTANATVIRSARSNQSSVASQTALVQRIRGLTANANVVFAMSTRAGYLAQGSANIQGAMTFVAQVREIHIEEIVYVIPAEMWVYEIGSETRQYSIGSETREYIIT